MSVLFCGVPFHSTLLTAAPLKDLLIYCENIESSLRSNNELLSSKLNDAQLDLADATKSRRELQQRLQTLEQRLGYLVQDNEILKVHPRTRWTDFLAGPFGLKHVEPQPLCCYSD